MPAFRRAFVLAGGLAVLAGCGAPVTPAPSDSVDLSAEWSVAAPEAEQVDGVRLSAALDGATVIAGLRSVLVVRHGRLIAERYLAGGRADSLYALRSVTKSVMSLLVGLAIEHGIIRGPDQPLAELFHSPLPPLDATRGAITIGDLLTMTSGFQWDQIDYLLARPVVSPPGSTFNYNAAAVHLLSAVLEVDAGGTAAFADGELLGPLGIHARNWELDNRQIPLGVLGVLDYGDLWWLGAANGHRVVLAWGHGGQFIYVVPDLALVVVNTATWQAIGGDAHAQETAIANLIVNRISPTIQ